MKISLIITLIIIVIVSIFVWRFLGKPYYRINLIGTEYIENSDELIYANEHLENKLYLIKKYKYSEDKLLIGFGGGNSVTNDYYYYGVSDESRNILLEPKFKFISSKTNSQEEIIVFGILDVEKGNKKMMFYKIVNGKVKLIEEKASK